MNVYELSSATISQEPIIANLRELDTLLSCRKYKQIIENSNLFWLLFCKAVSKIPQDPRIFSVHVENNNMTISGGGITLDSVKAVEDVRVLLVSGVRSKIDFSILIAKMRNFFLYIFPDKTILDGHDVLDRLHYVFDYFQQCLPATLKQIGLCIEATNGKRDVITHLGSSSSCDVLAIKVKIPREDFDSFSITPKKVDKKDLRASMQELYEKQLLCDFQLFTSEDSVVQVHSTMLFLYGGKVLQSLLGSSTDKRVSLEFCETTTKNFADFLYLEPDLFQDKVSKAVKEGRQTMEDLYDLFRLAHKFDIEALIDQSTNLIVLRATGRDLQAIKELADTYENSHLQELCRSLAAPDDEKKEMSLQKKSLK